MGVKGLTKYISDRHSPSYVKLESLPIESGRSFIVVDGYSIYRKFGFGLDWLRGGEYGPAWHRVADFMQPFLKHRVEVVVVYDGNPSQQVKLAEWKKRRLQDRKDMLKALDRLAHGELPSDKDWEPSFCLSMTLQLAFQEHGARVIKSFVEGDQEVAILAQSPHCLGVLSNDSDFFIFPGLKRYFFVDHCDWHGSRIHRLSFFKEGLLADMLGLSDKELPVLAAIMGNDFSSGLPARPKHLGAQPEQIAEELRACRSVLARGVRALVEHWWPSADHEKVAKALQVCIDQYSVERGPPFDHLGDAHYHSRIPAHILPARLQLVLFEAPRISAPGRTCPALQFPSFDRNLAAWVFADVDGVATLPYFRCSLHSKEAFSEEDLVVPRDEAWPTCPQIWASNEIDQQKFFERLCGLPSSSAMCCCWGSLGCALLGGALAAKSGALDIEKLRDCLVAMILVARGCADKIEWGDAPTVDAVHDSHLWLSVLCAVEIRWRMVFDAGRFGQPRRPFLQPERCLHGPLTCAVLANSSDDLLQALKPKEVKGVHHSADTCVWFINTLLVDPADLAGSSRLAELCALAQEFNSADPTDRKARSKGKGYSQGSTASTGKCKGKIEGKSKGKSKEKGKGSTKGVQG